MTDIKIWKETKICRTKCEKAGVVLAWKLFRQVIENWSDMHFTACSGGRIEWRSRLKPWSNGVGGRRKLKTWVYLRLRLARACAYLRWLAMTCSHFGRDQICTQVKITFSPFGHTTKVMAIWVTAMDLLLANETEDSLPKNILFCELHVLGRKLAIPFGHPTQVST